MVDNATGAVVMWSEAGFPEPGEGQSRIELTPELADAFKAVTATYGVSFDGQTFSPIPEPPAPPPREVTPLQLRRALNQLGLRSTVEAYVAQSSADVRDAWEFATAIQIDDPLLVTAATALGVNLGDLFSLAGTFPRYG